MKKNIIWIALFLMFTGFGTQNSDRPFQRLHSLEGIWKMNGKQVPLFEKWTMVDKNNLQSKSYYVKGSDTVITERVKLTNTRIGIFYTPIVEDQNNKQPIDFKLTKVEGNSFVFTNPVHDFPKRIVYTFITTDSLHAFADDGTDRGKRQNFYFKRQ